VLFASRLRRSAGALRAPNPDFESVCHAPRGEKETAWFWIWKFEPIFFRKSRIPSGFSLEAIILACLLSFMNLAASSNRLLRLFFLLFSKFRQHPIGAIIRQRNFLNFLFYLR